MVAIGAVLHVESQYPVRTIQSGNRHRKGYTKVFFEMVRLTCDRSTCNFASRYLEI